jgi:hypothetical protein
VNFRSGNSRAIQEGLKEIDQGIVIDFVDVKKDLGLID